MLKFFLALKFLNHKITLITLWTVLHHVAYFFFWVFAVFEVWNDNSNNFLWFLMCFISNFFVFCNIKWWFELLNNFFIILSRKSYFELFFLIILSFFPSFHDFWIIWMIFSLLFYFILFFTILPQKRKIDIKKIFPAFQSFEL